MTTDCNTEVKTSVSTLFSKNTLNLKKCVRARSAKESRHARCDLNKNKNKNKYEVCLFTEGSSLSIYGFQGFRFNGLHWEK